MEVIRTRDHAEAAQLLASGGRLRRLAHDMVVDLTVADVAAPYSLPPEMLLQALDDDPESIAAAAASSTTPEHADFAIWSGIDRAEYWTQLLAGKGPCGAVLPEPSALLRSASDGIVGAVVVTEMEATEWWAGDPWLPELFVAAALQGHGLGSLLLAHAIRACADGGYSHLGLTVSEGNPARHLYERSGFQSFRATWFIEVGHRH